MDQRWIVGALIEDEAGSAEADRLHSAMSDAGFRELWITAVGSGQLRVSFYVDAPTAETAERKAVEILARCADVVGLDVDEVTASAR